TGEEGRSSSIAGRARCQEWSESAEASSRRAPSPTCPPLCAAEEEGAVDPGGACAAREGTAGSLEPAAETTKSASALSNVRCAKGVKSDAAAAVPAAMIASVSTGPGSGPSSDSPGSATPASVGAV